LEAKTNTILVTASTKLAISERSSTDSIRITNKMNNSEIIKKNTYTWALGHENDFVNKAIGKLSNSDKVLILHHKKLNPIHENTQLNSILNGKSIERLDMYNAGIVKVPKYFFNQLTSLKVLRLHGNEIQSLREDLFYDLVNLEELELYKNKIQVLPNNIFKNNVNLNSLCIDQNPINFLDHGIFRNNKKLGVLYLPKALRVAEHTFWENWWGARNVSGKEALYFS